MVAGTAISCLVVCTPVAGPKRVHTAVSAGDCVVLRTDDETGATEERCPGHGGFDLIVSYDDQRQSVSLVDHEGNVYPLDIWTIVAEAFASLGPSAEWYGPAGSDASDSLIVEVREARGPVHFAVAKVAPPTVCLVGNLTGADAKNQAVRMAARASSLPCLTPPQSPDTPSTEGPL